VRPAALSSTTGGLGECYDGPSRQQSLQLEQSHYSAASIREEHMKHPAYTAEVSSQL
jgi:hypothetical protein